MKKPFTDCLLACDIDGTLAIDQEIHPDNVTAMRRFCEMGGRIVLATGRTPQSAAPLVRRLLDERYLIANNGALIYDCRENAVVWEATLDFSEIVDRVRADFPNMGILAYWQDKLEKLGSSDAVEWLINEESLTVTEEHIPRPNKMLFGDTPERLNELEAYLRRHFSDFPVDFVRASPRFTELLPKGVDKGSALRRLTEMLGVDRDHQFTAGNYYNDITMLDAGRISCAPEGSPAEVLAHATYVARPCEEGAVADFIEYLTAKV